LSSAADFGGVVAGAEVVEAGVTVPLFGVEAIRAFPCSRLGHGVAPDVLLVVRHFVLVLVSGTGHIGRPGVPNLNPRTPNPNP